MPLDEYKRNKNLKLLDYIALLLVTEDKGDVAAVTMERLPNAVIFHYSKNAPCSPEFGEYLQRLIEICASVDAISFARLFLTEVIKNCRRKIESRLNKCKRAIKSIENIHFDAKVAAQAPRAAKSIEKWRGTSFGEIAEDFLKRLRDHEIESHKEGSITDTMILCVEAFHIGRDPGILQYPTLAARIKKFGDYFGATRSIRDLLRGFARRHLQPRISMIEIRPTPPRVVQISRTVDQILHDHGEKFGYGKNAAAVTAASALRAKVQIPAQENNNIPQRITVFSHCELTLALHFYASMPTTPLPSRKRIEDDL